MKKTATLLAGLLLVTGTVFGATTGWNVTAADVQGTFYLVNTGVGSLNSERNDLDITLKTEKDLGNAGTVGLKFVADKDDDTSLKLTYTKTEGDFTVATTAKLADKSGGVLFADGIMAENDNTYIQWNVMGSKTTSLTFYPSEVGGMSWDNDTWESFKNSNNSGGIKLATKLGASDLAVKFSATEGTSSADAKYTVKGEFGTKVAAATVNAAVGYSTSSKTSLVAAKATLPMGKLTVNAEFNTTKIDQADAALGIFAKASYAMGDKMGYTTTPYASVKMLNDVAAKEKEGSTWDAFTEVEAGIAMKKGSFTITPKVVIDSADSAIYGRVNDAKEKTAFNAGIKVAYGL